MTTIVHIDIHIHSRVRIGMTAPRATLSWSMETKYGNDTPFEVLRINGDRGHGEPEALRLKLSRDLRARGLGDPGT